MRPSHYRLCELTSSTLIILLFALISSIPTNISLYAQVNNTLTPEQINEVEKDPQSIIQGCSYRLGQKLDPGKLCDAFTNYLHDKCERLDYLSDYCGPIAIYFPKRIIQKQCISNPPLPSDEKGIQRCIKYVAFNSTYAMDIPLRLTLKSIDFDTSDDSIKTVFSVFNPNTEAVNLISISYNITKGENKITSGGIGESESNVVDCPTFCFDVKPVSTRDIAIPLGVSNPGLIQSGMPYLINGTLRYENSSSVIVSKQFNFTSQ